MDEEFRRRNEAQFDRAERWLQQLGRTYIILLAEDVVIETPGFGNQYDGTNYIPTGRLRGGWDWRRSPLGATSKGYGAERHEDGPFSDYGRETVQRITSQVTGRRISGISYLENDVAYGDDIVRGEGNHAHIGPRDFPMATARRQQTIFRRALAAMERI